MVAAHHSLRRIAGLLAGMLILPVAGCALFDNPRPARQSSAFSWLTQWVSQPIDVTPGFDIEALRPEPRPAVVAAEDLLEVTVWDLYEPGKPHTFPVRVTEKQTIETPFLGEVAVADRTPSQVEAALMESYKAGEFLVQPRVLVRRLDPPTVKVQVGGAVQRMGFVELSRADTSVYAALISAGGLKKTAGTHVGVLRRSRLAGNGDAEKSPRNVSTNDMPQEPVSLSSDAGPPQQHANSLEILSVETERPPPDHPAPAGTPAEDAPRSNEVSSPQSTTPPGTRPSSSQAVVTTPDWYDLTRMEDRQALRRLQLGDGDEVIVKAATLPVRIGGVVQRPGAYPLPTGRALNVWQALELSGGVKFEDVPLNITLIRPAAEGRAARRWFLNVDKYDQHPAASPLVEPGDVLHVEPTTGSKLKRAAQGLWSKP